MLGLYVVLGLYDVLVFCVVLGVYVVLGLYVGIGLFVVLALKNGTALVDEDEYRLMDWDPYDSRFLLVGLDAL